MRRRRQASWWTSTGFPRLPPWQRTARATCFSPVHAVTDARPDVNGPLLPAYGIALLRMARPYSRRAFWGIDASATIGVWCCRLAGAGVGIWREPPRGIVATSRDRPGRNLPDRDRADQAAVRDPCLWRDQ